ncbi:TerD family protein [Streptomyces sp. NPDC048606]|uniref:TerD family protein n=1 Tax=Streptomyces sp. NPDC048606 TaxID=3154726 RepID=UPI003448A70E
MSGVRKGLTRVEIALRWDPSAAGEPPHDLDLVAAVYASADPHGEPVHLVHFGSRSPDGTITLSRDSRTGQGFGFDEVMVIELDRMASGAGRVVVGVVIQDAGAGGPAPRRKPFAAVPGTGLRVRAGYEDLATTDFAEVADATAATVAEFTREDSGGWTLEEARPRGFEADAHEFTRVMGAARA